MAKQRVFPPRYVFVGGLHRSGTSLLARLIGAHPQVAAIRNAPVPENEGCYLQGAIPHTARHGAPMQFATDPDQHLTEDSRWNTLETRDRLQADWAPWFDPDQAWRIEKSPVNLTRTRLYQQLFPLSQFVIVIRHPEAVAAAVAKWVPDPAPALIDHWLAAHDQLATDLAYLHAAIVVRYEDLVMHPDQMMNSVFGFLSLSDAPAVDDLRNGNDDYAGATTMTQDQAARAQVWGYGPGLRVDPRPLQITHPLRAVGDTARAAWFS